jgi:hypothetical protein
VKLDEDRHLVWGWASVSELGGTAVIDKQGDVIDARTLEDAAIEYMVSCRQAGVMHQRTGVAKLVTSIVFTRDIQKALGVDLGRTGWFVGFKVEDLEVWKRIKSGELRALSIHGKGCRKEM